MKSANFKKILVCLLLASTLSGVACADKQENETPTGDLTSSITEDAYNEKISYCMAQIASLQDQLKRAEEDKYVMESNYKVQISALETTINSLKSQLNSSNGSGTATPPTYQNGQTGNQNGSQSGTQSGNQSGAQGGSQNGQTDTNIGNQSNTDTSLPFTYIKENNGITITKYTGYEQEVEIPEKIDGLPVLSIGESAFETSPVKTVKIPEGVTKLDWFSFRACTQLVEIHIPASVQRIEYGAFDSARSSFIIICPKASFAEAYAKSWGYICVVK